MFATPIIPCREALFADPNPPPTPAQPVRRWIEAYGEPSTTTGGVVSGRFKGERFDGRFDVMPTEGDCITSPITKAAITGETFLHR